MTLAAEPTTAHPTRPALIHPGAPWPDNHGTHINAHGGGVLFHHGTYYWYGEHKIEGDAGNRAQIGVHVYRSTNLIHWTDCGIALAVSHQPGHDIEQDCVIERPKVIYNHKTHTFVMWFHLELKGQGYRAARTAVATSDSPTGPFRFLRSHRMNTGLWPANAPAEFRRPLTPEEIAATDLIAKKVGTRQLDESTHHYYRRDFHTGQMSRDMNLFVDDDHTAYHIAASEENSTLHITKLTDDYLSSTGHYVRIFPNRCHEAPALFKHAGRYYMISSDCTGWTPNPARLSVADHILGPWQELGNPCRGTATQNATTFDSQSTCVISTPSGHIYMGDRWCPQNAIDGRYIWLPIEFENGTPILRWHDAWSPAHHPTHA
jgi:hypothetical protein